MPTQSVDELANFFEVQWPDVWRAVYNRKFFQDPGDYYSAKLPAVGMVGAIQACLSMGREAGSTALNITGCAAALREYDYPTFYVGRELIAALYKTRPPKNLTWGQLKLPFPAMIFMLPRGFLKHPTEGDIGFLGFSKLEKGHSYQLRFKNLPVVEASVDKFTVFWACHESDNFPIYDTTVKHDTTLIPNPEWIQRSNIESRSGDTSPWTIPLSPDDRIFSATAIGLVSRLILLMQARPQYVEYGTNTGKRLKKGDHVWTPNFIGRKYCVVRKGESTATGITQRLNWREGHYRGQWYGVGLHDYKVRWIEPYFAGGNE